MQQERKQVLLAEAALLLCGIIWGSGFVVMKNTLDFLPINWLLASRFTIAAVLLCGVLFKKVRQASKLALAGGAICGAIIYIAYLAQTHGLQYTTAGNNAFLTAVYVVLVPFFSWIMTKRHPGAFTIWAGIACLVGVGVIALDANFSIKAGAAWTLLSGILYACHVMAVSYFTRRGVDVMLLTALQFAVMAVCGIACALIFEPAFALGTLVSSDVLFPLLYLGLACTLGGLVLQNIGIRYAPASHASLLMATEAPFGCLFGILLLDEPFTLRFALGAALILGSIILSACKHREAQAKPAQVAAAEQADNG